jgi:hypothetical protein
MIGDYLIEFFLLLQILNHSFYSPLFDPEAFHTGNYTEITQQCGCLFYKQKSPREEAI